VDLGLFGNYGMLNMKSTDVIHKNKKEIFPPILEFKPQKVVNKMLSNNENLSPTDSCFFLVNNPIIPEMPAS
jgi:hypothetical protein